MGRGQMIDQIIVLDAVIGLVTLLMFGSIINRNLGYLSAQLDSIESDNRKIKSDIEQMKQANQNNAYKEMQPKYLDPEALYRSYGGQLR